jgi:hypothetical protein
MKTSVDDIKAPKELFDETWSQVTKELNSESERACAIVGGAYLDDLLGELVELYLVENADASPDLLDSGNGNAPLGTFGARILIAYAVGLLPKDKTDALRKIKKIRNKFAHDLTLSFNEPSIAKLCEGLSPVTTDLFKSERTSKEIFIAAVAFIAGYIREHIYMTSKFELKGSFKVVFHLATSREKTSG